MFTFCVLTLYYYATYYDPLAFHYSTNIILKKCISQACNAPISGSQIGGEFVSPRQLETSLVITTGRGVVAGTQCVETRDQEISYSVQDRFLIIAYKFQQVFVYLFVLFCFCFFLVTFLFRANSSYDGND